jgi:hypothetical protein
LVKQFADQVLATGNPTSRSVCVAFDEVHIRGGLVLNEGKLYGVANQSILPMEDVTGMSSDEIATQVLLILATTVDGCISQPIAYFPTATANSDFLVKQLEIAKKLLAENGLFLDAMSGDCCSANMKTFKHFKENIIAIPDYSHVLKNIRNAVLPAKGHKLPTTSDGLCLSVEVFDLHPNEFKFLGEARQPRDKQSVPSFSPLIFAFCFLIFAAAFFLFFQPGCSGSGLDESQGHFHSAPIQDAEGRRSGLVSGKGSHVL